MSCDRKLLRHGCLALVLMASLLSGKQAEAKTRYFVQLQGIKEQGDCKLAAQAGKLIKGVLAKFPQLTTELGGPVPKDKKALAKELKRRGLQGYAIVFRITSCKHELHPPAKGKVFKVLMVEVATAIDAEKIPSGQMALAGTGAGQIGTEVSRINQKELASLRAEALGVAAKQAVGRFVSKLGGSKNKRGWRKR